MHSSCWIKLVNEVNFEGGKSMYVVGIVRYCKRIWWVGDGYNTMIVFGHVVSVVQIVISQWTSTKATWWNFFFFLILFSRTMHVGFYKPNHDTKIFLFSIHSSLNYFLQLICHVSYLYFICRSTTLNDHDDMLFFIR